MTKKLLTFLVILMASTHWAMAQRFTDQLDRGLVAVKAYSAKGTAASLSWRRLANEYYDTKYNIYRNGTRISTNYEGTFFTDYSGSAESDLYQIAAVIGGVEQSKCPGQAIWGGYTYLGNAKYSNYLDITLALVYDRDGNDVTANYEPNDAEVADLDGDGQMEIIIKRLNTIDASTSEKYNNEMYSASSKEFVVFDAYDVNWQTGEATLMWRLDCGPNMVSLNSTEVNIIAYDWDEDGKAEVVLRGADNMIVYGPDGKTALYTIGDGTINTRNEMTSHTNSQYAWTKTGAEYLIYMNGETGALYQKMDYPLKRLESGETDLNAAWGDNYGHRSTKHFLGAPFLDGRKASLFLGRGIYTRHKMIAMDLDRSSHTWSTRWTWACNNSSSPWYGNGYHNFVIADVDEDGRDEIVYGSMVIDDNGKGLSTTGYQHGDAQHVSDFDPWRKGLEMYACLEDGPYYGSNYRNAATSEVYYKFTSTSDDGRCLMGNFLYDYPGSIGKSSAMDNWISSVTDKDIAESVNCTVDNTNSPLYNHHLNFTIYWDGDLCSEVFDSGGSGGGEGSITKPGLPTGGRIQNLSGITNNSSKNNSCFQGDIIGDWREEVIMRYGSNIRVHTSSLGTSFSLPCLWYDHQYRQAMVWQMMAYNQPPHLSYFLGELEGITQAPPPLTMAGRTEIEKSDTVGTDLNGQHVLFCNNVSSASSFTIAEGAQPSVVTVNTPTWVQGTDENGSTGTKIKTDGSVGATNLPEITTVVRRHTLKGTLTGSTRLTKQGDGTLTIGSATHTHSGRTDVWAGTLECNGALTQSPLWLNRFTTLTSTK